MDIPIYNPREDYDYVVRRPRPQAPEPSRDRRLEPDRAREIQPQKGIERDERTPIQRRLESLTQRATERRILSHPHPKRERALHIRQRYISTYMICKWWNMADFCCSVG